MDVIIYIGKFLIWRPLPNSPNSQIKNLAKVSCYTVCTLEILYGEEVNLLAVVSPSKYIHGYTWLNDHIP